MALLTLTGGPAPPQGRTLTTATQLTITYRPPYSDGQQLYPREHHAELDTSTGGWKPIGASNGEPFLIPGAAPGEPPPPPCVITERQVYSDGEQTVVWPPRRVIETSPGAYLYGSLPLPLLAGNTVGGAGSTLGCAGAPVWPFGGAS